MKNVLTTLLLLALAILITACATSTDPSEAYKGESPKKIYADGIYYLRDKSYTEAVKRFEALDVQYPFGEETQSAQLYLIYAYYMKEEYALAVVAADRYIRIHPTSSRVDYAYYMRGMAYFYQNLGIIERWFAINLATRDLTQIKKSYDAFAQLATQFPRSRYAPAAHQYMIYLRNVMADHELQIAQYYYNRKAYVASANRAGEVVAHYQGAPAVIPALRLLARSYEALGLTQNYLDTVKVMRFNGIAVK